MQSSSDDTGVTLQKTSPLSDVDFGAGEPYLDPGEDGDYLKRLKQLGERQSRLAAAKMEGTENEYDNTNAVFPSTSKEGQPSSLEEDGKEENEEEEEDDDDDDDEDDDDDDDDDEEEEGEKDKDSLEDCDDKSETSESGKSDQASECVSAEDERKVTKVQTVSERLTRDAMSLKRHQLQEPRQQHRERDRGRPNDRNASRAEGKRSPRNKSKRDESRKRIGDPRKSFKASHELYGEEYPTKFHLPPRSPTFSFRSTIDLLPSTHRKQGLRQQAVKRKWDTRRRLYAVPSSCPTARSTASLADSAQVWLLQPTSPPTVRDCSLVTPATFSSVRDYSMVAPAISSSLTRPCAAVIVGCVEARQASLSLFPGRATASHVPDMHATRVAVVFIDNSRQIKDDTGLIVRAFARSI
ncbi:hypothetical protein FHG87_002079 [Trinorchestia longiramus]|nr:hypothetical protein FHG87_002079 [Trinorchestia longiramus]